MGKKHKTVIFGTGAFAREILPFVLSHRDLEMEAFVDTDPKNSSIGNFPVLREENFWAGINDKYKGCAAVVAIADAAVREKLFEKIRKNGVALPELVHSSVVCTGSFECGPGTVIYPNVCAQVDVRIGQGVLVNAGVTIGHDVVIGDFANVNPGVNIAGNVFIGKGSFLGIGSCVIEKIKIGQNSIIGAGAVVTDEIPDNVVAVGVPAKVIRLR